MPSAEQSNENKTKKTVERKGKKEQICKVKYRQIKEHLYILKTNCKGKRTVGKANKGINVERSHFLILPTESVKFMQ